jgi:hypothetical protein
MGINLLGIWKFNYRKFFVYLFTQPRKKFLTSKFSYFAVLYLVELLIEQLKQRAGNIRIS